MAPSTAAPHDPGGATTHVSRFSSKLPSLWRGSRGLLSSLLPMPVGSGGMAGGGGGPTLRDLGGDVLELLVGRLFLTGGGSSPPCGRFGFTGTRSSSGVFPCPEMPLHIQLRDFIFLGTEVALAPRTLYPCCDRPCCCTIWGHR